MCSAVSCHLKKSKEIYEALKEELGVVSGQTTKDNLFTLELVSCLGLCDKSPAMMVNDCVYGNLTSAKAVEIVRKMRRKK